MIKREIQITGFRRGQTSHKYFYIFIGLLSLVVLMGMVGGVRSVDSKRSAAEAKEKKQRELEKALFVDRVVGPPAAPSTRTANARNPMAPMAGCSTVSNTVTCTGSSNGATISPGSGTNGTTAAGSPYPTTIVVSGGAGTVASLTLTFHGYTSVLGSGNNSSRDVGILLKSPGNRNMQVMRAIGTVTPAQSNLTFTLQDGATAMPDPTTTAWSTGGTFKPSAYDGGSLAPGSPNYTVSGGPAMAHSAAPLGADTLTSVFAGDTVNGTWSLYLVDDNHACDITFSSWDIAITFSAASTPSTTTLTPSPTTAYTASPLNSVTLTAVVTSGATGTITFKDNGVNLTCAGGNPASISSNQATCVTSFSTEGIHPLTANYSGDGTFVSSTGSANVFIQKHATNVGTTYCNTGTIANNGQSNVAYTATSPYPSVIFVGDGTNTDIAQNVSTVSVTLKGFQTSLSNNIGFLLVAPDGTHAFDFWKSAGAGAAGTADYTVVDGSPQLPNGSALTPGTYGPGAFNIPPDPYTPGPPSPAPQVPATFNAANPEGSGTFLNSFTGAPAHGAWALHLYNAAGSANNDTKVLNGWCLNITPATGHPTTTVVTSNPTTYATTGASVTFTATVSSSPAVGNTGTVTFTENATTLVGAPNGGVANVVNGVATISTSSLPEGDHTISAQYHDSSNTFSDSIGTHSMREDKATSTPTLNGSTWSYCNTGAILIPRGTIITNDFGQASPNPSNVFVTNLPGTINSVGLTLKGFVMAHGGFNIESLLVGPNGANPPTTSQTLDFFSLIGNNTAFGPQDTVFADGSPVPTCSTTASGPGTSIGPTSCPGTISYFASPFYTLPGTFQHATTQGSSTFHTGGGGVYQNSIANGTWSLYFNQPINDTGSGVNNGWCLNFVENPPVMAITGSHAGNFRQGDTADTYTIHVTNNGPGPTGDPDGLHPVIITEIPPAGLTITGMSGTGWTCAVLPICKRSDAINSGSSYPDITVTVSVGCNAGTPLNNTASVQGGGASGVVTSAGDSTTVSAVAADGSGTLSVLPTTALAGATGQNFTFTYTAAAGGLNGGEIDITIPAGWSGGSASTNNGAATITAGVIKVTGITTPSAAGSVVTIGYNGANVSSTAGQSTFSTKEKSGCVLTALASSPAVTITNTDTWTGGASTDWNNTGNWSPGPAPSTINDVSIPNVATKPTISANDITVNSLNVAASSTLTINAGRTLSINVGAANSNASIDGQIAGGGVVQFGSGSHNLGGVGSFASTISSTLISGATVSLSSDMQMGSLTISGGATINLNGHALSLSGAPTPLTVGGAFNTAPRPADGSNAAPPDAPAVAFGTVLFNGAAAQSAPGITYGGLAINNSSGVALSGDATVNNQLALTNGDLDTASFTLTMPPAANSSGSGDVIGNVKRTGFSTSGANTLSFGNPLNTIQINSDSVPADNPTITVNLVKAVPAPSSPGHSFPNAVQRTYKITPAGITGFISATLQLRYLSSELNNNTEASLHFWKFLGGGAWQKQDFVGMTTTVDTINHDVKATGVTGFSEWTMASAAPTAANVTTLTLNPANGARNGNRGQAVGWGFTIVDDTYWVVVAGTGFCSSFDVNKPDAFQCTNPVPHGTYDDFTQYNFFTSAPGMADTSQQNFTQTLPCSTPGNCLGTGSFTIDSNAPVGALLNGVIVVDYNLFDGDPTQPGSNQIGGDFFIKANASVFVNSPTAATSTVTGRITDDAGNPVEGAVIRLSGTQDRKTITDRNGNYSFAEVETNGFYTVTPSRVNYNFAPSTRGFSALGAHTELSFGAALNGNHQNPLDTTEYFVRQQYVDFLGREPEEKGFNDWTDIINNCAPGDASCDRVHVSEAFFRSAEFQQRGYFIYRLYSTAFGQKPDYAAFASDLGRVSGFLDATQLEAAKTQFANDFINRPAFALWYNSLTNAAFVNELMHTAGVNLSNRQTLIDSLDNRTASRAQVLRQIAESGEVYARYYNQAFVVMEYFGYLRRDPDAFYLSWIQVLDANPADSRRMVEGFVDATEYRKRFKL